MNEILPKLITHAHTYLSQDQYNMHKFHFHDPSLLIWTPMTEYRFGLLSMNVLHILLFLAFFDELVCLLSC